MPEESTLLVLKRDQQEGLKCKLCGSDELKRLLSPFAVHQSEASRLDELDPGRPLGEDYYKDDRNVGLLAKKRCRDLGVDLGDALEEKVEKARSRPLDDLIRD